MQIGENRLATLSRAGAPFGMSRAELTTLFTSSPHTGALGLSIAERGEDAREASLILPARDANRLRAGENAWHPGAIGSAMDTILSMGALSLLEPESRPATVDLRWDLFGEVPFGDLKVIADAGHVTSQVVFSHGSIIHVASGNLIGRAEGCIAYAPPPDGVTRMAVSEYESRQAPDFASWLGLTTDDAGIASVPYREALGGAVGFPFWHGGALTAAMTAAAIDRAEAELPGARLMTATSSFNLFAIDQPVLLDTSDWRATRTRASVYVACSQEERGVTTRLAAHFGKER